MVFRFRAPIIFITFAVLFLAAGCTGVDWQIVKNRQPTQTPVMSSSPMPEKPQPPSANRDAVTPTLPPDTGIWVASPGEQEVLRINPDDNSIEARIRVGGAPDLIVSDNASVWALERKSNLVLRIDPSTNLVIDSISLPPGDAQTLALGNDSIWVGMTGKIDLTNQLPGDEGEIQAPGKIIQISAESNEILDELPVQPVSRIAINGSALWVLSRNDIDTPLQVYDLNTREGMAVPLRNSPEWLPAEAFAVGNDSLWLLSAAYGQIFHATPDGHILAAVSFNGKKPTGYADLLLTEEALWAVTPWGTILHIDRLTNHLIGQIDLDIPMTSLSSGAGSIWAHSQQKGIMFRIDPNQTRVIAEILTGEPLQPTIVPTPTSRIVVWSPCPGTPTSRLKVGDIAYVTKDPPLPNRVRQEPDPESEVLGLINPGGSMDIIDGPACANGWVWWKVKNAEYEGWTAEGDAETYWLIPLYQ